MLSPHAGVVLLYAAMYVLVSMYQLGQQLGLVSMWPYVLVPFLLLGARI